MIGAVDNTPPDGYLKDCVVAQMSPDAGSARSYADGVWGLHIRLVFTYVGPLPVIGEPPIESDIQIIDNAGILAPTYWKQLGVGFKTFLEMGLCHFRFEAVGVPPVRPTAYFTIVTAPPIYESTTVEFDASGSTGGNDGDDPTVIDEYRWDWGDGTNTTYLGVGNSTGFKHYPTAGDWTVTLVVVAPGIGWINASYVNTSAPFQRIVSVKVKALSYIDVYTENQRWAGGTMSGGWIITTWNGTGPNMEADAYTPQENVTLFAIVVWKGDIVQNKEVAFEIMGPPNPYYQVYLLRTATTDVNGIATITFRIPWPCTNAEDIIFGEWKVWGTVSLAEIKFEDFLNFTVGWTVEILSVTPDKDVYKKAECINVTVWLQNIAKEDRDALLVVVVYDDVGAVIGRWATFVIVHPGTAPEDLYCHLPVPKWAFCGPYGWIYANAYTKWPEDCGVAWCPEADYGPIEIKPS